MSLTVYGPDDTWPTHQKPWWKPVLGLARDAGWSYEYLNAPHKAGDLICPASEHVITVDKTAGGSDFHAGEAKKTITFKCKHGRTSAGGKVRERLDAATRRLETAETLIDQADGRLAAIEFRADADERLAELDRIVLQLESAGMAIDDILLEQDEALADSLADVPALTAVEDALDAADAEIDKASAVAAKIRKHGTVPVLQERARVARNRIERLRARVAELEA